LYKELEPYAQTESQRQVIAALISQGTQAKAAKFLGRNRRGVERTLRRVRDYAALKGFAPEHGMTQTAPQGFSVRGTSTLYNTETGEAKLQWVKTGQDADRLELLREAALSCFEDVQPLPKIPTPQRANKDLLAVYPMGDPHLGMLAIASEAGEDFDLKIGARELFAAVDRLVEIAPAAETAVILNLGDFFHSDSMENRTRRSGNALDVDTRWSKVLETGLEIMVRCVRRALEKHKRVIVRNNIGNHDEHTSIMLSIAMRSYFRENKRVEIDTSPNPFWYFRHGKCLLGSTHGDRTKPAALPEIMAADRSQDWGATDHRFWYTGHIHHQSKHEFRACTVESFRTLASSDAWHHGQGYRSGRDMRCIVHHSEFGEIESHRVGVESL
tara:strand:+ start:765 stop:1919 length:1155 start_codon:yes stop_codon:yes gene_type:complete